ncbi:MAG: hypothetical protein IPP51_15045 [Bacteroidetes bacterium]|nr:hypothetical protein [Bacteroidota bacterium]
MRLSPVLLLLLISGGLFGQSLSNLRSRSIPTDQDTVVIDTLSISPGTIQLRADGEALDTSAYSLDPIYRKACLEKGKLCLQATSKPGRLPLSIEFIPSSLPKNTVTNRPH